MFKACEIAYQVNHYFTSLVIWFLASIIHGGRRALTHTNCPLCFTCVPWKALAHPHPHTYLPTHPLTHSLTHSHMHKIKDLKNGFVFISMDAYFYKLKIIILVISIVSINGISHAWISLGRESNSVVLLFHTFYDFFIFLF